MSNWADRNSRSGLTDVLSLSKELEKATEAEGRAYNGVADVVFGQVCPTSRLQATLTRPTTIVHVLQLCILHL